MGRITQTHEHLKGLVIRRPGRTISVGTDASRASLTVSGGSWLIALLSLVVLAFNVGLLALLAWGAYSLAVAVL